MAKRRTGRKNPDTIGINLGELLTNKLKELHVTNTELGRRTNRPHSAFYSLRRRPSMQAYLLWELSVALEYDFFSDISRALLQKHSQVKSASDSAQSAIASLQK